MDTSGKSMLSSLSFLSGQWQALSKPGEPTGGFNFAFQLHSKIIVRNNHAEYPAAKGRDESRHEDLMIIYCDESQILLADYYDSEGHIIHYKGLVNGENQVIFTSIQSFPGPRYRLSYQLESAGKLNGTFEIAEPNQPDVFAPYLSWSAIKTTEK